MFFLVICPFQLMLSDFLQLSRSSLNIYPVVPIDITPTSLNSNFFSTIIRILHFLHPIKLFSFLMLFVRFVFRS